MLYQGTIPVQTELTVPTEPAVLTASPGGTGRTAGPAKSGTAYRLRSDHTDGSTELSGYPVDKLTMADQYLTRAEPYQATFGEALSARPTMPTRGAVMHR